MKLGYNYLHCDYDLFFRLKRYREKFLKAKVRKQGYTNSGVQKGTPELLEKWIIALDRKVKHKSIFNKKVKKQYFEGINKIWAEYYDELSKEQKPSKFDKKINKMAEEHLAKIQRKLHEKHINKLARERQENFNKSPPKLCKFKKIA